MNKILKISDAKKTSNIININDLGMDMEEYKKILSDAEKKPKHQHTPEEQAAIEQRNEELKKHSACIDNLRALSIIIPLIIFGTNIPLNTDITIDNFTNIIDDSSWQEFMPKGIDKEMFKDFIKYFDREVFIGTRNKIREQTKNADNLNPVDRIAEIAKIFLTFKKPDKETVLTPWRVVNMHMCDTIGGYNFYDDYYEKAIDTNDATIKLIDQPEITKNIYTQDDKVLDINSKII